MHRRDVFKGLIRSLETIHSIDLSYPRIKIIKSPEIWSCTIIWTLALQVDEVHWVSAELATVAWEESRALGHGQTLTEVPGLPPHPALCTLWPVSKDTVNPKTLSFSY